MSDTNALHEESAVAESSSEDLTACETEAAPSRGRLAFRRLVRGFAIAVGVLAVVAAVLYGLGGPVGPTREQRAAYEAARAADRAPGLEVEQLVVPIPGCVCHSDDPYRVVQHAEFRIRDCSGCH